MDKVFRLRKSARMCTGSVTFQFVNVSIQLLVSMKFSGRSSFNEFVNLKRLATAVLVKNSIFNIRRPSSPSSAA